MARKEERVGGYKSSKNLQNGSLAHVGVKVVKRREEVDKGYSMQDHTENTSSNNKRSHAIAENVTVCTLYGILLSIVTQERWQGSFRLDSAAIVSRLLADLGMLDLGRGGFCWCAGLSSTP
jgi:hypothetical protein